jgi:hypothetical protein
MALPSPSDLRNADDQGQWTGIAASSSQAALVDIRGAELLRLSSDPLLLHRYLQMNLVGQSVPPAARKDHSVISKWIGGKGELNSTTSARTVAQKSSLYMRADPILLPSLEPEPYIVTEQDILMALDADASYAPARFTGTTGVEGFSGILRACIAVICLALAVLIVIGLAGSG